MNKRIINRVKEEGKCMIDTGKTVREIASIFGVSKSTVHKDLKDRLLEIDSSMYDEVSKILKYILMLGILEVENLLGENFLKKMQISSIQTC